MRQFSSELLFLKDEECEKKISKKKVAKKMSSGRSTYIRSIYDIVVASTSRSKVHRREDFESGSDRNKIQNLSDRLPWMETTDLAGDTGNRQDDSKGIVSRIYIQ